MKVEGPFRSIVQEEADTRRIIDETDTQADIYLTPALASSMIRITDNKVNLSKAVDEIHNIQSMKAPDPVTMETNGETEAVNTNDQSEQATAAPVPTYDQYFPSLGSKDRSLTFLITAKPDTLMRAKR